MKLPAIQEVEALVSNLDANLNSDPELGRAQLRRWLNDSFIKIDKLDTIADIDFFPARILLESQVKTGSPNPIRFPG